MHRKSAPQPGEGTLHVAEAKGSEIFLTSARTRCPPLERKATGWELKSEPGDPWQTPAHHRSPRGAEGTAAASTGLWGCRTSASPSCPLVQHSSKVLQSKNATLLSSSLLLEAKKRQDCGFPASGRILGVVTALARG